MISTLGVCLSLACGDVQQEPLGTSAPSSMEPDDDPGDDKVEIELSADRYTLTPGDTQEVRASITPRGVRTVNFALIGDMDAAYLDRSVAKTDADGMASVRVTVVRVPTQESEEVAPAIRVLAGVDGAEDEMRIEVVSRESGTLRVVPVYTGLRTVEQWAVARVLETSCADIDLFSATYSDTFDATTTVPQGQELAVYDPIPYELPIMRRFAILLRGEHYIYGCREGVELAADQELTVSIALTDRPLRLPEIEFGVRFGLESSPELTEIVGRLGQRMLLAFRGGYSNDLAALLGNMAVASGNEAAFIQAQATQGWADALISSGVFAETGADSGLSSRIELWLTQGLAQLFSDNALRGQLMGSKGAAGSGLLQVNTLAGAPHSRVGLPRQVAVTFDTEGDTLQLSTRLLWESTRLLAGLAEHAAVTSAAEMELSSMSEALSVVVDCPRVAGVLAGSDDVAFDGCDTACMTAACEGAFVSMWEAVIAADLSVASLTLSAAGPTNFDTAATPLGFSGTWVGQVQIGEQSPIARGTFVAGQPPGEQPPSAL